MQSGEIKVLVACEESQAVCKAFRERGFEAYSCDIQECSGGHPEWHICGDALKAMMARQIVTQDSKTHFIDKWDLMIAHPPCTYRMFLLNIFLCVAHQRKKLLTGGRIEQKPQCFLCISYLLRLSILLLKIQLGL